MTSLARGLCVIQAFTQKTPQMTISQLSLRTGLSRAAVRRCLYTLTKLGFAGSDDGQRYSLRPRILTLSNTYTASNSLSQSAQPILDRMSAQLHESSSVVTLDGDDIVYIARTTVTRVMSADLHIGSRLPAFCTSMGRVLLAYLPPDQLEAYLGARGPASLHQPHGELRGEAAHAAAFHAPRRLHDLRPGTGDRSALDRRARAGAVRPRGRCDQRKWTGAAHAADGDADELPAASARRR